MLDTPSPVPQKASLSIAADATSNPGFLERVAALGGRITGLVHVGANVGQEARYYHHCGVRATVHIEPIAPIFDILAANLKPLGPGHMAIKALCDEEDGRTVDFFIASNGGASSSMLDFGWCRDEHPDVNWIGKQILTTQRLDTALETVPADILQRINMLVLDTQSTELRVLAGAPKLLEQIEWIHTEVSETGLYKGGCSVEDVLAWMGERGFRLKWLDINRHRWGDALFHRPAS